MTFENEQPSSSSRLEQRDTRIMEASVAANSNPADGVQHVWGVLCRPKTIKKNSSPNAGRLPCVCVCLCVCVCMCVCVCVCVCLYIPM